MDAYSPRPARVIRFTEEGGAPESVFTVPVTRVVVEMRFQSRPNVRYPLLGSLVNLYNPLVGRQNTLSRVYPASPVKFNGLKQASPFWRGPGDHDLACLSPCSGHLCCTPRCFLNFIQDQLHVQLQQASHGAMLKRTFLHEAAPGNRPGDDASWPFHTPTPGCLMSVREPAC